MDAALGRYLRMARLRSDDGRAIGTSIVPDLYDVHLISMSSWAFSLTDIERIDAAEFAQSRLVTAVR